MVGIHAQERYQNLQVTEVGMWRISQRLLDHTLSLLHEIAIHFGGADETGQSRHYDFLILFIVLSFALPSVFL
jgi:hypothetical protein